MTRCDCVEVTSVAALLRNPNQVLTNEQVRQLQRPLVYVFMKAGEVLYVGSSQNGIGRVVDPHHHRSNVRGDADEVRLFYFPTIGDTLQAEAKFIRELQPLHNVNSGGRGEKRRPPESQYCPSSEDISLLTASRVSGLAIWQLEGLVNDGKLHGVKAPIFDRRHRGDGHKLVVKTDAFVRWCERVGLVVRKELVARLRRGGTPDAVQTGRAA